MSGGFTCHETKSVREYLTDLRDFVEKRLGTSTRLAIPQVYNTQVHTERIRIRQKGMQRSSLLGTSTRRAIPQVYNNQVQYTETLRLGC